jgi:hypothetical protein
MITENMHPTSNGHTGEKIHTGTGEKILNVLAWVVDVDFGGRNVPL